MGKLQDNLQASRDAVSVVDLMLHWGAANKPDELMARIKKYRRPQDSDEVLQGVYEAELRQLDSFQHYIRTAFERQHPHGAEPWTADKLVDLARIALRVHAGQCTEQVAVAFTYLLHDRSIKPLDFMIVEPREAIDHVFLVIGRVKGTNDRAHEWPFEKAPPWGPDAVVCDPWSRQKDKRAYPAAEIGKVMTRPWGAGTLLRVE